jgi:carnitine-CoA ligase
VLDPGETYSNLADLVRGKARKNGSRVALRFASREISYTELDRETDRVANGLARAGIAPGDRVACLLLNTPEFPLLWFGAAKRGAILVPLNTALKGEILRYELADSAPAGLVIDRRLWEAYAPLRDSVGIPREWVADVVATQEPTPPGTASFTTLPSSDAAESLPSIRPSDPVSIMYTSGTTGPPKGAIIPHQKQITTPIEIGLRSRLEPDSVLFTALPLFHCNAQEMTVLTAILNDLTAALDERFHASAFWETAARYRASHVSLLISMINVLYKQPERPTDRMHTVRTALTAGTTRAIWADFERRFGLTIVELYGMTECGCTTLMNPPAAIRVGSVGTPLGFVEADVVDDHDRPVPPDTRGELVVRPSRPFTMFSGYHNKPEKTVEAWRNLWFHTGDYVTRDADGYYYFVDRKKDVIRRRGENLAPYDVESVLNRHPAVFESVVVGVPSPLGEEDVKAFVQLRPGVEVDPKELFEFCVTNLPFFMVPKYLEFLDEIPKTANQKAQRFVLRERRGGTEHDRDKLGIVLVRP